MAGDPTAFERAWAERVDDLDACIAAHYLARVQPDARSTLEWNERALSHARRVDPGLVRGFMPSLHLNLGKSYEDTGDLPRAAASYRDAEASPRRARGRRLRRTRPPRRQLGARAHRRGHLSPSGGNK